MGQVDLILVIGARPAGFLDNLSHLALVLVVSPLVDDFLTLTEIGPHIVVAKGSGVLVCFLV